MQFLVLVTCSPVLFPLKVFNADWSVSIPLLSVLTCADGNGGDEDDWPTLNGSFSQKSHGRMKKQFQLATIRGIWRREERENEVQMSEGMVFNAAETWTNGTVQDPRWGGGEIMENNLEEKRRGLRQQENRQIIKKLFWRNPTKENETYINCRKQSDCLYLMFYSVFQMNEQQSLFTEEQSTTLQVSQWKWTLTREWLNFIWITGRFGVNNYSFSHRS